jgi:signal transduction histidine kinase
VAPKLPPVTADPDRVEQVVTNLVVNALKYGAEGGRVDIRACARNAHIVIEVQDYGAGIDPAERIKIFQLNFRAGQKADEVSGMGIGLALCRELVELHGGSIGVTSEEGKGSVFEVALPVSRKSHPERGSS